MERIKELERLNAFLLRTLEDISQHADGLTHPGGAPSFSKTAISHFTQIRDTADRARAYADLKRK